MKFKDLKTGAVLTTNNAFCIEQYQKMPDRYKEIKEDFKKEEKK